MATIKEYRTLRAIIIEELEEEEKRKWCQCEDQTFSDDITYSTTTVKHKKPFRDYYGRLISETTYNTWKCPYCDKLYEIPVVAIA